MTTHKPANDAGLSDASDHPSGRRLFIGGALALGTAPWLAALTAGLWNGNALAADGTAAASDAGVPSVSASDAGTVRTAFIRVSKALCGDIYLDAAQASVLLDGLQQQDGGFADACVALDRFISEQATDPLQWQAALDAAKAPFAALPRRIVSAWYIGVVGSGTKARALTYVTSLMYRVTADRVRPPSYAYGSYGSWRVDPTTVTLPPLVAPGAPA